MVGQSSRQVLEYGVMRAQSYWAQEMHGWETVSEVWASFAEVLLRIWGLPEWVSQSA